MFTILDDRDTIAPQYPCGGRGTLVSVSHHSTDYAVWKLIDDLEKHIGAPRGGSGKAKCQACYEKIYNDKAETEKALAAYMQDMTEASNRAKDVIISLSDSVLEAAGKFFALNAVFGPGLDADAVEPYEN